MTRKKKKIHIEEAKVKITIKIYLEEARLVFGTFHYLRSPIESIVQRVKI